MKETDKSCPDCKNQLDDVRAQDDRVDFWCNTCKSAFNLKTESK